MADREGAKEGNAAQQAGAAGPSASEAQAIQQVLGAIESKFVMMSEVILGRSTSLPDTS